MIVLDFAAARRRVQSLAAQEVELDAAQLAALAPRPTLAAMLGECVQVLGPRAVYQEIERGAK